MKLTEILNSGRPSLSFEVFPPKDGGTFDSIREATENIARLSPSFMSVTCRAGGTSQFTVQIAANLQKHIGTTVLAHLTCVNSTREGVMRQLEDMREAGIENVLALRGDIDPGVDHGKGCDYRYAGQLVADARAFGGFCIGGACYPEGHTEAASQKEDIVHLKEKVDAGCEFLTTQMFFDNNILYNFLYKIREAGITVPVIAGIMPVTKAKQIRRITSLSGTYLPQRFVHIVDRYGENPAAMRQAGIAYATEQIIDLYANGVSAVHVYSMNDATVAAAIQANISEILR